MTDKMLLFDEGGVVKRATDPIGTGVTPTGFSGDYPVRLDPQAVFQLANNANLLRVIPEVTIGTKEYTWREITSVDFAAGKSAPFPDGDMPETFDDNGETKVVNLKTYGVMRRLKLTDILHSAASAGVQQRLKIWNDDGEMNPEIIADLKAAQIKNATALLANALDKHLVIGDSGADPLQFDGLKKQVTAANGAQEHIDAVGTTFDVNHFDKFLSQDTADGEHIIVAHPQVIEQIKRAYWSTIGTHTIFVANNDPVAPGVTLDNRIMTSIGEVLLVPDRNFGLTDNGDGTYAADIYVLNMRVAGEPLVYRVSQIPMSYKDLAEGATSIGIMVWTNTALVVKGMPVQKHYKSNFAGVLTYEPPTFGV